MTHNGRRGAETQAAIDAERQTAGVVFSVNQNNFAPGGSDAWARAGYVPLEPDTDDLIITGFEAPSIPVPNNFQLLKVVYMVDSTKVTFVAHENAGSTDANKIRTTTTSVFRMNPLSFTAFLYNVEDLRWDMVWFANDWQSISGTSNGALLVRLDDGQFGSVFMATSVSGSVGTMLIRKATGEWDDSGGGSICEVVWGEQNTISLGAGNYPWSLGNGGDLNTNVDLTGDGTITISLPTNGIAPGSQGRLKLEQDVVGSHSITDILFVSGTSPTAHFTGGVIYPLTAAADSVDIWDWYTPDGNTFYFSRFGDDFSEI